MTSADDRHAELVRSLLHSDHAIAVSRADLPPLSEDHLHRARIAADAAYDVAERRAVDVERSLGAVESEHRRALDEFDRCQQTVSAAQSDRDAIASHAAELDRRSATLDDEAGQAVTRLEEHRRGVDEVRSLTATLAGLLAEVTGSPLHAERRAAAAVALESLAARLLDAAPADERVQSAAPVLLEWSRRVADGTAPIHPEARAMLDEYDRLCTEWTDRGAGDPAADPTVVAARGELSAGREALAKLESQATTGALGERLRRVIERAHETLVEVESRGRRADLAELTRAREAEAEALSLVGFDSMLDYRLAVATSGHGALADTQRANLRDRIEAAERAVEQAERRSRALHEELRRRGGELEARVRANYGLGEQDDPRAQLALVHAVPDAVAQARDELAAVLADGEFELHARDQRASELRAELATLRARRSELETEERRLEESLDAHTAALRSATDDTQRLAARVQVLELELRAAVDARSDAAAARERLVARPYVDDDVEMLCTALHGVLDTATRRAATHPDSSVVVDDPLSELSEDDASRVLDSLCARDWPAPVQFVTRRAALRARRPSSGGTVQVLVGRRIRSPRWRARASRTQRAAAS